MIIVNGKEMDYEEITLQSFLQENGYNAKQIAVECNEDIVPKSEYANFILHSGDVVEVVSFVGGG